MKPAFDSWASFVFFARKTPPLSKDCLSAHHSPYELSKMKQALGFLANVDNDDLERMRTNSDSQAGKEKKT